MPRKDLDFVWNPIAIGIFPGNEHEPREHVRRLPGFLELLPQSLQPGAKWIVGRLFFKGSRVSGVLFLELFP